MAIDLGQETKTVDVKKRTRYFEISCELNQPIYMLIYREKVETDSVTGGVTTTPDATPIRLVPSDLPSLAPFMAIPDELKSLIPDEAAAAQILSIMPGLIAIACDAADQKAMTGLP